MVNLILKKRERVKLPLNFVILVGFTLQIFISAINKLNKYTLYLMENSKSIKIICFYMNYLILTRPDPLNNITLFFTQIKFVFSTITTKSPPSPKSPSSLRLKFNCGSILQSSFCSSTYSFYYLNLFGILTSKVHSALTKETQILDYKFASLNQTIREISQIMLINRRLLIRKIRLLC